MQQQVGLAVLPWALSLLWKGNGIARIPILYYRLGKLDEYMVADPTGRFQWAFASKAPPKLRISRIS